MNSRSSFAAAVLAVAALVPICSSHAAGKPFTPERHDALSPAQVFMARYDAHGALIPIPWRKK